MTREEHLLTMVSEESGEISKEACKALRFGLGDKRPGTNTNNAREMLIEVVDLITVLNMLLDENPKFAEIDASLDYDELIKLKKLKIDKYFEHSRKRGKLS